MLAAKFDLPLESITWRIFLNEIWRLTKWTGSLQLQQDAAVSSPAVIQASIPEQGRMLTFSRAVAADKWEDLQIGLKAKAVTPASWLVRLAILAGTVLVLGMFVRSARAFRRIQ